tara:strand:- start:84762 stop:85535 length:774 start_codon:yes stop_codon:yes gene_type:complete
MANFSLRGKLIGNIKAVLFDKDGTLTNSEFHLLSLANARVLAVKKRLKESIDDEQLTIINNLLEKIYGLTNHGLNPHSAVAIASRHENLLSTATAICSVIENWPKSIDIANDVFLMVDEELSAKDPNYNLRPLLPGVKSFLNKLHQSKVKCALISNDSKKGIEDFLELNNLHTKFCHYWSCEHSPSKPDPNAVKELCKKLNLTPGECALIGDSDSDLKMARKAGIGIAMGYVDGWKIKPSLTYQQELISNWEDLSCH